MWVYRSHNFLVLLKNLKKNWDWFYSIAKANAMLTGHP